ncbi:MAG: 4Fe-4S dicluster domain-containing protein, partial [Oscillospiraceae bacterium]|nr:4Fe-4S dicluster domain-containing protein [Oscillospiraceae bacterium]
TSTAANNPEKHARAKFCTSCGACVKKCPQNIDIPKELGNVKKYMEPWWFNAGIWLMQKVMS